MEYALTVEPTAEETAELQATIKQIIEQIEQADARIKSNQDEIERLKAETRAMLAQLKADVKA